jgi:hypothetical protein
MYDANYRLPSTDIQPPDPLLLVIKVLMASKNQLLILDGILVPQLRRLSIQRACATKHTQSATQDRQQQASKTQTNLLIRLPQQTLQAQQHALDIIHGAPLVLQDIQTYPTAEIHVGVVDGRLEQDGRSAVRVVGREGEGELEGQALVVRLRRARDGRRPREQVAVAVREGGDAGRRGHHELHELCLQPFWAGAVNVSRGRCVLRGWVGWA